MVLQLKKVMADHGVTQADMAREMGIARPTLGALINHGQWPRSMDAGALRGLCLGFLKDCGASDQALAHVFEEVPEPCVEDAAPAVSLDSSINDEKDDAMLMRKSTLAMAAKKHFGLFVDPLADEALRSHEDVFVTPDIRYVREAMWQTARNGGFIAVIGQSGSGKSTLRKDLNHRISREGARVMVIEPSIEGMHESENKGNPLKAGHIAEAILADLTPLASVKSSPEGRLRQAKAALRESYRAGNRHVLVIEEAHSLPITTLNHLKRFLEVEDGFSRVLSIILIGQNELREKLNENDPRVREVVQRCELIELPPLDNRLEDYIKFKFDRAGKPMAEVVDQGAIDMLRMRLTNNRASVQRRSGEQVASLLYPLAVNNLLTACMNLAADIGSPRVTADVVKEV
jgi:type II secretory pathway predicted ATPase ExeA/DNA-binding Xre family transcriptional regulator